MDPERTETPTNPNHTAEDGAAGSGTGDTQEAAPETPGTLEEAQQKADEYLDLLRRARADYANLKRRSDEERAQYIKEGARDLILKLLPILDDFERALGSATPEELDTGWAKGVQLIERNLRGVLAGAGVQQIQAQGAEFNPWEHEALAHQPTADADEGSVMQVVRPGYRLHDRVIRPAQVIVARRPD